MILFACIYLFILIANLNSTYSSGTELVPLLKQAPGPDPSRFFFFFFFMCGTPKFKMASAFRLVSLFKATTWEYVLLSLLLILTSVFCFGRPAKGTKGSFKRWTCYVDLLPGSGGQRGSMHLQSKNNCYLWVWSSSAHLLFHLPQRCSCFQS